MTNKDLVTFLQHFKDDTDIKLLNCDLEGDYHVYDIEGFEITNGCVYIKDHSNVGVAD